MGNAAARNTQLIRDLYAAYRRGDLEWLQEHLSRDVALDVAGASPIAGPYRGAGAVMAFGARAELQFVPDSLLLVELRTDEERVSTITSIRVRGRGLQEREMRFVQEYAFDDEGRISWIGFRAEEQEAFDEWVSAALSP